MEKLVGAVTYIGDVKVRSDDDCVDRLNHNYSVFILVLLAVLVSTKQYVGEPINCWVPAQFTHNHEDYSNKVCWVSNTYYMPFQQKKLPISDAARRKQMIGYYQWIPMILLVQATMFHIPCTLWRVLSKRSGIHIKTVLEAGINCHRSHHGEGRDRTIKYLVNHMHAYLTTQRPNHTGCWSRIKAMMAKRCILIAGKVYGNYLTFLYLVIKLLYLCNCVGQVFLLGFILNTDYYMFGIHVLKSLLRAQEWHESNRFPRVTLCDFEVRELGNIHRHTVQCVLPINLFNEKIYVFLWFWFAFVSFFTLTSLLHWTKQSLQRSGQEAYVRRQLLAVEKVTRETKGSIGKFTSRYLRQDGVFVIRLLAKNSGEVVAAEVLGGLWDLFVRQQRLVVDPLLQPPKGITLHSDTAFIA